MASDKELFRIHEYLDKHEIIWVASLLPQNRFDNVFVKIGVCKCRQAIHCYGTMKRKQLDGKWFIMSDSIIVDEWVEQFKQVLKGNKEISNILDENYKSLKRSLYNETA